MTCLATVTHREEKTGDKIPVREARPQREENSPRSGPQEERQAAPVSLRQDGPLGGRALCSPIPFSGTLAPLPQAIFRRKADTCLWGGSPSTHPPNLNIAWQSGRKGVPRLGFSPQLTCHPSQGDSEPTPVVYWRWEETLPSLVSLGSPLEPLILS